MALKYTEALQKVASAPNAKLIMMPLDAASLMGSIGGIAELARETFGGAPGGGNWGSSGGTRPSGGSVPTTRG